MTTEDFIYWLKGYLESKDNSLDKEKIKKTLEQVILNNNQKIPYYPYPAYPVYPQPWITWTAGSGGLSGPQPQTINTF